VGTQSGTPSTVNPCAAVLCTYQATNASFSLRQLGAAGLNCRDLLLSRLHPARPKGILTNDWSGITSEHSLRPPPSNHMSP
jgi:hypothetical protein